MVLGITGISGSGKHLAAEYFQKKNWVILDADTIAHNLYRPYTGAWKKVVNEFGEGILNKNDVINRSKLGKIVFNPENPDALQKLNQIIHPYIKRQIKNDIHRHFRRKSNIVVVAALWQELDLPSLCNKILLLKADPAIRLKRIQNRDGISESMYEVRTKNQSEPPHPDFVIENNREIRDLNNKLSEIEV